MGMDLVPVEEKRRFFLKHFRDLILRENQKEYILRAFYAEVLKKDRRGKLYVSKETFQFYNFRPITHYYPVFRDLNKMKGGGFRKLVAIYSKFYGKPEVLLEYDGIVGHGLANVENIGSYTIKYRNDEETRDVFYSKHFPFRFKMSHGDGFAFDKYFDSFYSLVGLHRGGDFVGSGMMAKLYALQDSSFIQTGFQVRLNDENVRFLTLKKDGFDGRMFFLRRGRLSTRTLVVSEGIKELLWLSFLFRNNFSIYLAPLTNRIEKNLLFKIIRHFGIKQVFILSDNDDAGEEFRDGIARMLKRTRDTAVMELVYSKDYKDFSDFVNFEGYNASVSLKPVA